MKRRLLLACLGFSLAACSAGHSVSGIPDMGAVGQAAAHLNDHQSDNYFLMVVIAMLLAASGFTAHRTNKDRAEQRKSDDELNLRLAGSIDKLAESIRDGDGQAMANFGVIKTEMELAGRDRSEAKADRARIARNLKTSERVIRDVAANLVVADRNVREVLARVK
jgi:hypothetical protein